MGGTLPVCFTPSAAISLIDRAGGNDLTETFSMRYRKATDPDVDGSYLPVTTTKDFFGITFPYFDISTVSPDVYILHTYQTSDGTATGTKVTIVVNCNDVGGGDGYVGGGG